MTIPDQLKPYLVRPVAVLGYGVSGRGLAAMLRAAGIWFEVYDERESEANHYEFGQKAASNHRLVVYSPGFPQNHPWLESARQTGCKLLGELDFASLFWGGALIAVTGTNGKTTIAEFLAFAFKRVGVHAVAVGNIGYPLSRLFEVGNAQATTAVCEVSSFQAESLEVMRPQAVVWTNFAEDHLDRYDSMRDYFAAKWRLVEKLARPRLIIGESVAKHAKAYGFELPAFTNVVRMDNDFKFPVGTCFESYPQRENYLLVKTYWEIEGRSLHALEEAAKQFKPPRHRLALIAQRGQVNFWNDSKATNFASAIAALKGFSHPVIWVGGGKSKGGDLRGFAEAMAPLLAQAFLIGEVAEELGAELRDMNVPFKLCRDLDEAVAGAYAASDGDSDVVLSPGFASFDQFSGYAERGIRFEKAVLSLKKSPKQPTSVSCAVISEKSS